MKKHKFTWLDGLVIAVVILLIAGTCYKFQSGNTAGDTVQETAQFQYQLRIKNAYSYISEHLQIGDSVYETQTSSLMGVIQDISIAPATATYTTSTGEVLFAEKEDCVDITLTLSAEGIVSGATYKIGNFVLFANKESTFHTKYSSWSAEIISID